MARATLVIGVLGMAGFVATPASGQVVGEISFESRGFIHSPHSSEQNRHDGSFTVRPELFFDWDGGDQALRFEPFLRVDFSDRERTHVDIRTLSWEKAWRDWELRAGIRRVFWGVTESVHLVDVINQTDLVEDLDGEEKLGQPMVNVARIFDWGTVDVYLLPGFRERTFPGVEGRLRPAVPVAEDRAVYESAAGRRHVDWAVRWSHFVGAFDLGVSHFSGTNRDPRLVPEVGEDGAPLLVPHYDQMTQTSLDAQYTRGGWLWKLEALTRDAGDRYWAMAAGFEYTLYQVLGSSADVGILAELLLDDRGDDAATPFEDDVFVGSRIALNDVQGTELLLGGVIDRKDGSTLLQIEGSRRLGEAWTIDLTARAFLGVEPDDVLYGLRRDDHLSVALTRHF